MGLWGGGDCSSNGVECFQYMEMAGRKPHRPFVSARYPASGMGSTSGWKGGLGVGGRGELL